MEDCKPAMTLILKDASAGKAGFEEKWNSKEFPYRECVEVLMYLMVGTCSDIVFVAGKASRSLENLSYTDWIKVKQF